MQDARDTNLVPTTMMTNMAKQMTKLMGEIIRMTIPEVATPLPPLNL